MSDKSTKEAYDKGYKDGHDEKNDDGIFIGILKDGLSAFPSSDEYESYEKGKKDGQKDREKKK